MAGDGWSGAETASAAEHGGESERAGDHDQRGFVARLGVHEPSLWLLALVTLTVDVYLTAVGLRLGLAEGNPVMAHAIHTYGFASLGLVKVVLLGVAGFTRHVRPQYGPVLPLAILLPWLLAVLINGALLLGLA